MEKNDSKKNDQLTDQKPTGLQGTQIALNIAQGAIDAMMESDVVTKEWMLNLDQKKLRALSKKVTQKFLGLYSLKKNDPWYEEKMKIEKFYKTCFKGTEWESPLWGKTKFPMLEGFLTKPEYIFSEMTAGQAFNAYASYFGESEVSRNLIKSLDDHIDPKTIQPRPGFDYVMLRVDDCGDNMATENYSDIILKNIIFMTPLEGIISAFRYRFENNLLSGKDLELIGLSALDCYGKVVAMSAINSSKLKIFDVWRDSPLVIYQVKL